MNYKKTAKKMQNFLFSEVKKRGFEKVVLGLSGGIDSAVVAALCARTFGRNTTFLLMPSSVSDSENLADALNLAHDLSSQFGCTNFVQKLDDFEKAFENLNTQNFENTSKAQNPMRFGNFCARTRMILLYDFALKAQALVIGTSNKSERLLGYGTIFGDLACAINPIGDVYKTQIFRLAKELQIPQKIIDKKPSADLFAGQSDEADLGYSYAQIDEFLQHFENLNFKNNPKNLKKLAKKFGQKMTDDITARIARNAFKQEIPKILRCKF